MTSDFDNGCKRTAVAFPKESERLSNGIRTSQTMTMLSYQGSVMLVLPPSINAFGLKVKLLMKLQRHMRHVKFTS